MAYIWLSYPLSISAPRPPAIPAPSIEEYMSIEKDGANVQRLSCYNHTGTHLDTAAHVICGGISINAFLPMDLVYHDVRTAVLELGDDTVVRKEHIIPLANSIAGAQAVIFKFGVHEIRKMQPERFSKHCPGFSDEAAEEIFRLTPDLKMIGTDVPSIACISHLDETMTVHNTFFNKASCEKFIIIEEMKLDVDLSGIESIIVSPWLVEGMNSGPCVIWAEK